MPVYSTSLGCLSAPYLYHDAEIAVNIPLKSGKADHSFDVRGGAVGTFIIAEGSSDSSEVKYRITLSSNDRSLLQRSILQYPKKEDVGNSRLLISTPRASATSCIRFDIIVHLPPRLKKLHVASHCPMHVKFDPASYMNTLDDLYVTLYSMDARNMILPHKI